MNFQRAAEIQVVLEGIALPAARDELVRYAAQHDAAAAAELERLPDRKYERLDEIGEELVPTSPVRTSSRPLPKPGAPPPASIYNHALTVGFSRAFVVAAGIGLLALLIALATIRVSRQELAGAAPEPQEAASQPAASQPGTVQRHEDRAALAAAARPCRFC